MRHNGKQAVIDVRRRRGNLGVGIEPASAVMGNCVPQREAKVLSMLGRACMFVGGASLCACVSRPPDATGRPTDSATVAALAPPPARELSQFDAPLEYDFTPILAIIERSVPKTFGSLDSVRQAGDDARKHYAYMATRGPFTMFARGSLVHVQATLSYSVRAFYKPIIGPTISASCGLDATKPRLTAELVTPISLTSTWHLKSRAQLAKLAPASATERDRCKISFLHKDITDQVRDAADKALRSHMKDIDAKVAGIDLTQRAQGWWNLLTAPIRLTDGVWLVLQPATFRLGAVEGKGRSLLLAAGLDAYPLVVTGPQPSTASTPLPPLVQRAGASGFRIAIEGLLGYHDLSRTISNAVRGTVVKKSGRSITLQSVEVKPAPPRRLSVEAVFTGDAAGRIVFLGSPKYDAERGEFAFPDLAIDVATDNDLLNAYTWLQGDSLQAVVREKARVPVAPILQKGRESLTSGLNRTIGDVLTLSSSVDSVGVSGIYVMPAGLLVRAKAYGKSAVTVRQRGSSAKPRP